MLILLIFINKRMIEILWIVAIIVVAGMLLNHYGKKKRSDKDYGRYNKDERSSHRQTTRYPDQEKAKSKAGSFFSRFKTQQSIPFDEEAIQWCTSFLGEEEELIKEILPRQIRYYRSYLLRKRSGGFRTIYAPKRKLYKIQRTIYQRILLPVNLHPSATGFRQKKSIVDNAGPHLGKAYILKVDIYKFFDSIRQPRVTEVFQQIGYPHNIARVLSQLCCIKRHLPQGAATSPALSNIVLYPMDQKLTEMAGQYGLTYTRYADDLTFSGDSISKELILDQIKQILHEHYFIIKRSKTRFLTPGKRKIITGVSISSGEKMTIPKAMRREIRKKVYFITTKGLKEHQRFIGSRDRGYLKRLIGQLSFWHSIEPENPYVIRQLSTLKRMEKELNK